MPFLPLPPGATALGGGALPVTGADDVLADFPEAHREPEVAPVRDAFVQGFAATALAYQTAAARAAGQADPTRATGVYLDLHGADRDVNRRKGEDDNAYRPRLFAAPLVVTPEALLEGVNALLSTVTTKQAQLVEPQLDGLFIHDCTGTEAWDSFIGAPPTYLDRLYEADAASNDGVFLPGATPGSSLPTWGESGRAFFLRIPALENVDVATIAALTGVEGGVFLFDGTETVGTEFLFTDSVTADEIYAAIVDFIQRFKGQGIAWSAYVDPTL